MAVQRTALDIDLRVDLRGVRTAVAEDLADLVQDSPERSIPVARECRRTCAPMKAGWSPALFRAQHTIVLRELGWAKPR